MKIISATFVKGVVGPDDILLEEKPQIAFIGRSNVGKSSIINSLVNNKKLAVTSSFPGRTQQVNVFDINKEFYLIDLPGYGYAKASKVVRQRIQELIRWYLFESPYKQKYIALLIDANIGPTVDDLEILQDLEETGKNIVIVANKIDKIKKSLLRKKIEEIKNKVGPHKFVEYSAQKKIGIDNLQSILFE